MAHFYYHAVSNNPHRAFAYQPSAHHTLHPHPTHPHPHRPHHNHREPDFDERDVLGTTRRRHHHRDHPHPHRDRDRHHDGGRHQYHYEPERSRTTFTTTTSHGTPIAPVADPLLAPPHHHQPAPLEFDVSLSPSHIMAVAPSSSSSPSSSSATFAPLSSRALAAPAVLPPRPFLRITCALLRWPIDIVPGTPGGGHVTVGDVLAGVYKQLRAPGASADWHALPPAAQADVRAAYKRRCRRQHAAAARTHEEHRGLRRVDWLGPRTLFAGIRPAGPPDHWEMLVRPAEKSVKFAL